jgi:hypothetical protein
VNFFLRDLSVSFVTPNNWSHLRSNLPLTPTRQNDPKEMEERYRERKTEREVKRLILETDREREK